MYSPSSVHKYNHKILILAPLFTHNFTIVKCDPLALTWASQRSCCLLIVSNLKTICINRSLLILSCPRAIVPSPCEADSLQRDLLHLLLCSPQLTRNKLSKGASRHASIASDDISLDELQIWAWLRKQREKSNTCTLQLCAASALVVLLHKSSHHLYRPSVNPCNRYGSPLKVIHARMHILWS